MKTVQFVTNVDTESPKSSLAQNYCLQVLWGEYDRDFLLRKIWPGDFVSKHLPHPWGKLSTLLHAFYNPPGQPGGFLLGGWVVAVGEGEVYVSVGGVDIGVSCCCEPICENCIHEKAKTS